jgi:capsular exopolysaccharide synthesis family protein
MPHDAGFPEPTSNPPRPAPPPVAGRIEPTLVLPPPEPAPPPPALTAGADLGTLLRCLRVRWMGAVALGVPLAALAAAAAWFLLSPKYTATSQINVQVKEGGPFDNPAAGNNFQTFVKTTAAQLASPLVIRDALKRDAVKRLALHERHDDPVQYITDNAKVLTTDGSQIITLELSCADAAEAVAVVKGMTESFMDLVVYAEEAEKKRKLSGLEDVFSTADKNLERKKTRLKEMAKKNNISEKEGLTFQQQQAAIYLQEARNQQRQLASDLAKAETEVDAARLVLNHKEPEETGPSLESLVDEAVDKDRAAGELTIRTEKIKEALVGYTNRSDPTPRALEGQLARLEKQLKERRKVLGEKVSRAMKENSPLKRENVEAQVKLEVYKKQVAQYRAGLADVAENIKRLEAEVARIGQTDQEMEALRRGIETDQKVVENFAVRVKEMRVEADSNLKRVTVFQEAELQKKDIKKQLMGTAAAPLGVLLAVCMGLATAEHRQRRIRTAGQVADGLGIRVVGAVPEAAHLDRHLVGDADLDAAQPVLESFDALRTLLLHDAETGAARVVMVTSAAAGEGKTTLASHLATSLARSGRKTLLLDGDLRRPAAHQLFEVPLQPGFSEALLAEVEVADALQQTTVPGLWVMPAGQWDREVLQALARDGLEGIFEKLREEFDFVIVDSHPVLPATDSLLIGRRADAVILSVRREVSQMPRVYAASQRLTALRIPVLGAVVNGADPEEAFATPAYAQRVAG